MSRNMMWPDEAIAVHMHKKGISYRKIGEFFGISRQAASQKVERALNRMCSARRDNFNALGEIILYLERQNNAMDSQAS